MLARIVRRLRSAEDKGVGDTLARMLDWFGAKDIAAGYVMMTGIEDCGCGDRQAKLNQLYPY